MRASAFFIATLKEAPNDAEIASHRLMIRAGLIRRLAGGINTWMPLGLRVLRKVEKVVREERRMFRVTDRCGRRDMHSVIHFQVSAPSALSGRRRT